MPYQPRSCSHLAFWRHIPLLMFEGEATLARSKLYLFSVCLWFFFWALGLWLSFFFVIVLARSLLHSFCILLFSLFVFSFESLFFYIYLCVCVCVFYLVLASSLCASILLLFQNSSLQVHFIGSKIWHCKRH
jgi:hypothetical protein